MFDLDLILIGLEFPDHYIITYVKNKNCGINFG